MSELSVVQPAPTKTVAQQTLRTAVCKHVLENAVASVDLKKQIVTGVFSQSIVVVNSDIL